MKDYAVKVKGASRESRKEAEAFVMNHPDLLAGASQTEIDIAIGKVARALWDLRIARLRASGGRP